MDGNPPMADLPTLRRLIEDLDAGKTTSRQIVETCLERIANPAGEGARAFIAVDAPGARAAADAHDLLRKAKAVPPLAGIPIAIKDLADIRGQVTRAGSTALADRGPATADAPVVARLRAAGLIPVGRANMTEFAYSGLGINPHYGTPASPWERSAKRVPGGSSSGSGVAVADGMAHGALGTDTGGSCRIPAAFNGVAGFKPTARCVPVDGVIPLSTSLDSIGPLARSVDCCALLDAVMAGDALPSISTVEIRGLRLHVPETIVLDGLDPYVAADFEAALARLSKAGAQITRGPFQPFEMIAAAGRKGGLSASESQAWHRALIEAKGAQYDPRVLARIMRGAEQSAVDYIELLNARSAAIASFQQAMAGYDAILSPTVAVIAPRMDEVAGDDDYARINMLVLRNTLMLNVLDGCSLALPMHQSGTPPTSLMISGTSMQDKRILGIGRAIEDVLVRRT
jgi:aspartyl-tRNA(Asn)/glutamyl-tRNA(Gln) amidotransferase subunit A